MTVITHVLSTLYDLYEGNLFLDEKIKSKVFIKKKKTKVRQGFDIHASSTISYEVGKYNNKYR